MLDNAPVQLIWLHRLVKLVELSVAPCIGLICGRSLNVRGGKWEKIIGTVLSLHVVVESLSSLMGWVWYVDAENVYHHGSLPSCPGCRMSRRAMRCSTPARKNSATR